MCHLQDDSFAFPIGLAYNYRNMLIGYYMNLIKPHPLYESFKALYLKGCDKQTLLRLLIKADAILQKAHQKGIILGDIKKNNILINQEGNPIFIDTDNFKYQGFSYDLVPERSTWLNDLYHRVFSDADNDKFIFTLMALEMLYPHVNFYFRRDEEIFTNVINSIDFPNYVGVGIREILSDSDNKPYLGEILEPILKDLSSEDLIIYKDDKNIIRERTIRYGSNT